jgi:hypothetical protein
MNAGASLMDVGAALMVALLMDAGTALMDVGAALLMVALLMDAGAALMDAGTALMDCTRNCGCDFNNFNISSPIIFFILSSRALFFCICIELFIFITILFIYILNQIYSSRLNIF